MKTVKRIGLDLLVAIYCLQLPAVIAYLALHL
jgi:hypothetical protein